MSRDGLIQCLLPSTKPIKIFSVVVTTCWLKDMVSAVQHKKINGDYQWHADTTEQIDVIKVRDKTFHNKLQQSFIFDLTNDSSRTYGSCSTTCDGLCECISVRNWEQIGNLKHLEKWKSALPAFGLLYILTDLIGYIIRQHKYQ